MKGLIIQISLPPQFAFSLASSKVGYDLSQLTMTVLISRNDVRETTKEKISVFTNSNSFPQSVIR